MNLKVTAASLVLFLFISSPLVLAGTVTRGFSSTTLNPGDSLTVTLTVDIDEGNEDYYAFEEDYPNSWTVLNTGGLNGSEAGLLKNVTIQNGQDTQYQYILQAPSQTGTYTWSGTYMFEGMSSSSSILGQNQVSVTGGCTDNDGDGYSPDGGGCGSVDCDDNPSSCGAGCYPGATEICDGYDNDCDSSTDEGCDDDNDDYCDSTMTRASPYSCSGGNWCCPNGGNDCNDANSSINPAAQEVCNIVDDDCDGNTDQFSESCGPQNETGICQIGSRFCSTGTWGVCSGAVYPEDEVCDELDNDCNGIIDDVNGGNSVATTHCRCYNGGSPLSQEVCPLNGIDDNCDGQIDENNCGCTPGETQSCPLQDGVCQGSQETCPSGGVWLGCNDTTYLAYNSSYEAGSETSCDNYDNNCDGETDESLTSTFYRDYDGDTYGDSATFIDACSQPSGYVNDQEDCNDNNQSINPAAQEVCNNVDDNCDGNVDFLTTPGDLGCEGAVIITAEYYDGRTTDFENVADTTNMADMVLEKGIYGMIEFTQTVNISYSTNLNPPNTLIIKNLVGINTTRLPFLNIPARIYLYNLTFQNPVILRNKEPCPSSMCQIISYSGGNLTFNVTGFSNYSATGSCSDGTLYGQCSTQLPRYCLNGTLVNRAGTCGCPSGYIVSGNDCVEEYSNGGGPGGPGGQICTPGEKIACTKAGECKPSYQTCQPNGLSFGPCEGPDPQDEVCDGLDNDCDGEIDEGITCLCTHGDTRVCGPESEEGLCQFGVSNCVLGVWGECEGSIMPGPELCDNMDNDCDGEIDEECAEGMCLDGEIPAEGCLCGDSVRNSGYCCWGLYYEDGCPFPWSLLILAGIITLLALYAYLFFHGLREKRRGRGFQANL